MKKMYMESLEGIEKKAVSDILTERGFEVLPAGEEKHGVGLSGSLDQNLNYAAFQMECRDGSVKIRYGSPTGFFRGLGEYILTGEDAKKEGTKGRHGAMFDCSRNGVLRVESIKKWIRRMALLGYSRLFLYTEDTYEVEGYPYFGALRGRYKKEEIRVQPDDDQWLKEIMSSQHVLGSSAIAISSLMENVGSMYSLARENVLKGFDMILSGDDTRFAEVEETENTIDLYNISISRRLSKVLTIEHGPAETKRLNSIFQITGNVERVGDHAMNFAEHAVFIREKGLKLSKETIEELKEMREQCRKAFERMELSAQTDPTQLLVDAVSFERAVDDITERCRDKQVERINNRACEIESSVLYSEILIDYERIGDHMRNIAEAYAEQNI